MIHKFVMSEDHPYNQPEGSGGNCRDFPVDHWCVGNHIQYKAPILDETYRKGTMIHKILGDNPIEGVDNHLIENSFKAYNT